MYTRFCINKSTSPWLLCIKGILDECGLSNVWITQSFANQKWLKITVKKRLEDQFIQAWTSINFSANSSINYRIFKTEFKFENYLAILPPKLKQAFINYRLNNNYLPVINGQWKNIPRCERLCKMCNLNTLGDEFHYLFVCDIFKESRSKYISPKYYQNPNCFKFSKLMQSNNKSVLIPLACYIHIILSSIEPSTRTP